MTMPGGGPFALGPGQITDDSELALCTIWALLDGKGTFNAKKYSEWYLKWYQSPPFDIGITTTNAIKAWEENPNSFYAAKVASKEKNKKSRSNGTLMKISPMIVWTSKMPRE